MAAESRPSLTNAYLVAAIAGFFAGAYALLDQPAPPMVAIFITLGPVLAIGLWFRRYLVLAGRRLPFDYGFFLYLGWWVLIPVEATKLHGRRGWSLVGRLFAVRLVPGITAEIAKLFSAS